MQVTVTRDEIAASAQLIEMLKRWEVLTAINGQYNRGTASLRIDGNGGNFCVDVSCDAYSINHRAIKTPVDKAVQEIESFVGSQLSLIAKDVCEIIRRNMPLPLEPEPK